MNFVCIKKQQESAEECLSGYGKITENNLEEINHRIVVGLKNDEYNEDIIFR